MHHSTIVLTNSHIALLKECHQWPLSRLHPPPNQVPPQFNVQQLNKITNIVSMVSLFLYIDISHQMSNSKKRTQLFCKKKTEYLTLWLVDRHKISVPYIRGF